MWLAVCADPDCPNKRRVEELEAELARLREQIRQEQETTAIRAIKDAKPDYWDD